MWYDVHNHNHIRLGLGLGLGQGLDNSRGFVAVHYYVIGPWRRPMIPLVSSLRSAR